MPPRPKAAEASSERAGPGDAAPGDVTRYEQLRQQVLAGDAGGWRLGLGVLQRRGVVAWLRAWDSLPGPMPAPRPSEPARPAPGSGDQLVAALATMALSCLAARG